MSEEEWRPIPGYEGHYSVSSLGRVRSEDRIIKHNGSAGTRRLQGKILACSGGNDYQMVDLRLNAQRNMVTVHSVVALAFHGPRPPDLYVCHDDGNHFNNAASNLRYDTPGSNNSDKAKHGVDHNAKKTHCNRNHKLEAPNLVGGQWRSCLSCKRGRANVISARDRRGEILDLQTEADRHYALIMQ